MSSHPAGDPLTWHADLDSVGAGAACLVGDGADVVTGVLPADAGEEESLVQDVHVVIRVLTHHRALQHQIETEQISNRVKCQIGYDD